MMKDTPEIFLNLSEFHNKSNMFTFYKLFSALLLPPINSLEMC